MLQVLTILQTAYPNARIDAENTFNLWFSAYGKVEFNIAKLATEIIIKTDNFFPSISRFGKAVERAELLKNTPEPVLIEAGKTGEAARAKELLAWVLKEIWGQE